MEIRARTVEDLDELVDVASRVHAVDGYPTFLPGGDVGRFLTSTGGSGCLGGRGR